MGKIRNHIHLAGLDDRLELGPIEHLAAQLLRDIVGLPWIAEGTMDLDELAQMCRNETVWANADVTDEPVAFLAAHELDGQFYMAKVDVFQSHQRQGLGMRF